MCVQSVSMTSDLASNSQPLRPIRPQEANERCWRFVW